MSKLVHVDPEKHHQPSPMAAMEVEDAHHNSEENVVECPNDFSSAPPVQYSNGGVERGFPNQQPGVAARAQKTRVIIASAVAATLVVVVVILAVVLSRSGNDSSVSGSTGGSPGSTPSPNGGGSTGASSSTTQTGLEAADELLFAKVEGVNTKDGSVQNKAKLVQTIMPLFLQHVFPNTQQSTTSSATTSPTTLQGTTPITLVFSKPLIPIGSDYDAQQTDVSLTSPFYSQFAKLACPGAAQLTPGRWRWVTTAMLRFDPSIPWPSDLSCTLTINSTLASWDGSILNVTKSLVALTQNFATPSLRFSISRVTSEIAEHSTGGTWSSNLFAKSPSTTKTVREVPTDGNVEVRFTQSVDAAAAAECLSVAVSGSVNERQFVLNGSCAGSPAAASSASASAMTTCVRGFFGKLNDTAKTPQPLAPETLYGVFLSANCNPSKYAAAPTKAVFGSTILMGLRKFTFDFFEREKSGSVRNYNRAGSTILALNLIHGLEPTSRNPAALETLKNAISIKEGTTSVTIKSIELLALNEIRLTLTGFFPSRSYTITVAAAPSIKDGFQQSLEASSDSFATKTISSNVKDVSSYSYSTSAGDVYMTPSAAQSFPVWGRARSGVASINAEAEKSYGSVNENTIGSLILALRGSDAQPSAVVQSVNAPTAYPPTEMKTQANLNLSALMNGDTLGVSSTTYNGSRGYYYHFNMLAWPKFALTMTQNSRSGSTFWATDVETGAPVAGANLRLYKECYYYLSTCSSIPAITLTTDSNGIAYTIGGLRTSHYYFVVAANAADKLFASRVYLPGVGPSTYSKQEEVAITTDRKMYRPGETVHASIVMKNRDPLTDILTFPTASTSRSLRITWDSKGTLKTEKSFSLSAIGTSSVSFDVPAAADFGK